ncbi:TPA: DegT/DnrJ/EryC1/StrS aminotransferase family protein [Vibrio parahaemolyticus]|uniref:UDP-4-amino-4-deoxy-L-arabinose--oxoglutarate aminotransferase n=1 Tax=Vibrio parahaemolyticus TaxID=670 RepID=A0A7M1VKQ1_VIBPH|nr:UDP-4-amino-4-deoxy-L-arabinose--oxoglutarate aminotransferase [Vibrio parahaemolyticus]HCM1329717.1 DegT/DnrJ/EryC1/StrS aminotransferase family protein [Vibrio parahaemolyticus]
MIEFLPFALPEIGEEEIKEVVDSLRSGWVTTGPKTKMFESDFIEFLGDSSLEAIAVNSATSGLHLALESVGVGPGDEVILPTYTFTATAEVVRYLGATPVFVDVDPTTFNMSASDFEKAVTELTKVVIPVHFAGLSCDMDEIISIARKHDIFVVEDAAHALPTLYKSKLIGTLGSDITVFSFYANKTMTTGEGGMLVTRNKKFAERCKIMRLHGISRDAFDRYVSTKPSWAYEVVAPGYKYNMPDISAAIGIHQLKKLPKFQEKRQAMAEYYFDKLKDLPMKLPARPESGDVHAWHLFPIQLNEGASISRDRFIELMAESGIGCSVHFIPLHLHPYWRDTYSLKPEMFPVAQSIYESEVSLPLYTKMTWESIERVVQTVRKVLSCD